MACKTGDESKQQYISEKPFPLFEYNSDTRKWKMKPDSFKILHKFSQFGKVKVISVVGAYRLGKSYLMNQLMHCESNGFELGHSTDSKTKGVWIWGELIQNPKEKYVLLCLDTEGLLDVDREDEQFDTAMFCVMTMLSSYLILNFQTRINSDDLRQLSFASDFTNLLFTDQRKAQNDDEYENDDIHYYTPKLLWLIRDFTLKLEGTEQDYLDKILTEKQNAKKNQQAVQQVKQNIKNYFSEKMELRVLPPPSGDSDILTAIEENKEQLSEKFVGKMRELIHHVRKEAPIKKILSPHLNAEVELDTVSFYRFCDSLIGQLNDNSNMIQLSNTFDQVIQAKMDSILSDTFDEYETEMKGLADKFPIDEGFIFEKHFQVFQKISKKALEEVPTFKKEDFNKLLTNELGFIDIEDKLEKIDATKIQTLLKDTKLHKYLEINKECSEKYCEKLFNEHFTILRGNTYSDFQECLKDLLKAKEILVQHLKGPSIQKYMTLFFKEASDIRNQAYLHAKITESERQIIELKATNEKLIEEKRLQQEAFEKEKQMIYDSMKNLQIQQQALKIQLETEKQNHSSELSSLRSSLNNVYLTSSSSKPCSSSSSSRRYYSSSDDDDYYSRGRGGRSGKTFYKGGQFIPGGGRAPKGGVWM